MKNIFVALLLTTVAVSPALAQHESRYRSAPSARTPDVYTSGVYRGTDPDPQVRLNLRRESPHGIE